MDLETLDKIVSAVRESKTPCNRTSFKNFCLEYTVKAFSGEKGVNLTELVKALHEFRQTEQVKDLGTLEL